MLFPAALFLCIYSTSFICLSVNFMLGGRCVKKHQVFITLNDTQILDADFVFRNTIECLTPYMHVQTLIGPQTCNQMSGTYMSTFSHIFSHFRLQPGFTRNTDLNKLLRAQYPDGLCSRYDRIIARSSHDGSCVLWPVIIPCLQQV